MKFPWKKKEPKHTTLNTLTPKEINQAEVMGYLWFPAKQQEEPKMDETKLYNLFEEAAEAILEHEAVMTSPIDGSYISMVRSEDVLNSLAETMGIDIKQTSYENYAK